MQTILGSGGAIGTELARALPEYTNHVRLVSRHPKKVNETDELFTCDLTDKKRVAEAVRNSDVVYLTAGLPYDTKVWQNTWPVIMRNVLDACIVHEAKLVFFDNIYMYSAASMPHINEEAPVNPPSKKGKIRAQIESMLVEDMRHGRLQALIARSADFYGPKNGKSSVLIETVIKPMADGKKANWLGDIGNKHSYTFTPDAGKATALLGNRERAFGEIWHLPTAKPAWTGRQWIEETASLLEVKPAFRSVSKWMVRFMGLFSPVMGEMVEMFYQYNQDYVFDSSKFENDFNFTPTPYEMGLKMTIEDFRS